MKKPTYTRVIWHNLKRETTTTTTQRHIRQRRSVLCFISYWHRTRTPGYFHLSCWKYLHKYKFPHGLFPSWRYASCALSHKYTLLCAYVLLSVSRYHTEIPFFFIYIYFLFIPFIVYRDCCWSHTYCKQLGYEVRFHQMRYLTNQTQPKMPPNVDTQV